MRIAVLIYGRLNKCIENYDSIINTIGKEHEINFFLSSDNSSKNLLDEFIINYKPIDFINDKIVYTCNFIKYRKTKETNVHNMTCHFINKGRVFTLLEKYIKKTDIKYDIVLTLRVDIKISSNFNFNDFKNDILYIPKYKDHYGINDNIAYGSLEIMEKYMNIFSYCEFLLNTTACRVNPEILTLANIKYHNLKVCRIDFNYIIDKT